MDQKVPTRDEVRDAWAGSITKWERIVEGADEDLGSENCPLCHMFNSLDDTTGNSMWYGKNHCRHCPVAIASGYTWCYATPYHSFCDAEDEDQAKSFAVRELAYLRSLKPIVDKWTPQTLMKYGKGEIPYEDEELDNG